MAGLGLSDRGSSVSSGNGFSTDDRGCLNPDQFQSIVGSGESKACFREGLAEACCFCTPKELADDKDL